MSQIDKVGIDPFLLVTIEKPYQRREDDRMHGRRVKDTAVRHPTPACCALPSRPRTAAGSDALAPDPLRSRRLRSAPPLANVATGSGEGTGAHVGGFFLGASSHLALI